ncbi:MAG: hypothetical protein LC713_06855 [Actinobacteria bacterium]|nr:hypothetical protein [Actinomycetota bacterium]
MVLDRAGDLWDATWQLLRIGYDLPVGWLAGGMMAWRTAARPLEAIPQITVHELRSRLDAGEVTVLDVRQPAEWAAGHIPGAAFVTGADLPSRLNEVPDAAVVATVCGSGYPLQRRLQPARRPRSFRHQCPGRHGRLEQRSLPNRELGDTTWTTPRPSP